MKGKTQTHLVQRHAHLLDLRLLGSRQVADLPSGNSSPHLAHSHRLAGSHHRTGGNRGALADVSAVQNRHTFANETVVLDCACVNDGTVIWRSAEKNDGTDHCALADQSGQIVVAVDRHVVLDVTLLSDLNSSDIA